MTLLARDEADIVDSWLDFHLNAGADFVIATDNRSQRRHHRGPRALRPRRARPPDPRAGRGPAPGRVGDADGATRGARTSAPTGSINSDADEFWWPRGESLRDVLAAVPDRYGTVSAFLRVFVPRPGDGPFAERMTVRFSPLAPINDPASLYKPIRKVIHRGHPEIRLTRGNHALVGSPFAPLRGWFPVEVFHFPLRTAEQTAHKAYLQGNAFEQHIDRAPTAYHRNMFAALARRADRRLLRARSSSTTRSSISASAREGSSSTRGCGMRCGRSRPGRRPRSRSRHSSRTPSTPWRPRFSARRTSCDSNAVSTSSRSACTRSRPDRPPACIARSRGRRDESSAASARWPDEADDLRHPDDPAQRLGLARRPPRRPPLDHGVRGAVPRHGHDRRPPRRNARSALRGHGRPVDVLDLGRAHGTTPPVRPRPRARASRGARGRVQADVRPDAEPPRACAHPGAHARAVHPPRPPRLPERDRLVRHRARRGPLALPRG